MPKIPFTIQKVCDYSAAREQYGKRFTIVVVAEGPKLPPERTPHPARRLTVAL